MKPKVSIVMPTKRKRFLQETLDSIMAQTLQDFELIILDGDNVFDGSDDSRIIHVDIKKMGMGYHEGINYGTDIARTDIIMFSCDDDIDLPHKAQTAYDAITNGADIFYASFERINEQGEFMETITAPPFDIDGLIVGRYTIALHSGGYRKSVSPEWRKDLFYLGDYAFFLDAHRSGLKIVSQLEPTIKIRSWSGQLCSPGSEEKTKAVSAENKKICELYNLPVFNR